MAQRVTSVSSYFASSQPSCIAAVPTDSEHLIIGTYSLEKIPGCDFSDDDSDDENEEACRQEEGDAGERRQNRFGELLMWRSDGVQQLMYFNCGILDIAFSPHDPDRMYAATSTGSILYLRVRRNKRSMIAMEGFDMFMVVEIQVFKTNILILDLEFHPIHKNIVGITTSTGSISLLNIQGLDDPTIDSTIPMYRPTTPSFTITIAELYRTTLEAWTLTFAPNGSALYFGSDDSTLGTAHLQPASRLFFTPVSPDHHPDIVGPQRLSQRRFAKQNPVLTAQTTSLLSAPASVISRTHTAGVTSILPLHAQGPNSILLTGSYDDRIRVVRPSRKPVARTLAERDLGGGVWRLKMIEQEGGGGDEKRWLVLVACMFAGAKVVDVRCKNWRQAVEGQGEGDGGFEIAVVAEFTEHESMCYGAEVVKSEQEKKVEGRGREVVSTSFYDKLVAAWEFGGKEGSSDVEEEVEEAEEGDEDEYGDVEEEGDEHEDEGVDKS